MSGFALACCLLGCAHASEPEAAAAAPDAAHALVYTLAPVMRGGELEALEVTLELHADAEGRARLHLPERWAAAEQLWRHLDDVHIDGARAVTRDGDAVRVVEAEPGAALQLRYRVRSAWDHDPAADEGQPFAPIVRPTWFYAFGHALFAVPEHAHDAAVHFRWVGAPPELRLASDLEAMQTRAGSVPDLLDSVVTGGTALRTSVREIDGAPLRIAVLGHYAFDDEAFADLAAAVIAGERAFWGDPGAPMLITLTPLRPVPQQRSLGGTGLGDAFTLVLDTETPLAPLRHLLAHEYFHSWNADQLGGRGDAATLAEGGQPGQWFSEGFTEFYTWRLLLRAGLYSLEDFVQAWNEALVEYAASPVRNVPDATIVRDYWRDPDVGRLPYRRGALLAAVWDHALRQASAGARDLDDVMLELRATLRDADAPEAARRFAEAYRSVGGPDPSEQLVAWVERGETITLPPDSFGACIVVRSDTVAPRGGPAIAAQQLHLREGLDADARARCIAALAGTGAAPLTSRRALPPPR
ncbi:MAG: hypothetical protein K1X88_26485 [Nannocystaceae bacterium]|nr:hypothetical protein [Nannocystaceae bacterium]